MVDDSRLREHLLATRLVGEVQTTAGNSVGNVHKLLAGEDGHTFGLSDWKDATFDEVLDAVEAAGGRLRGRTPENPSGIDADAALAAIHRQRAVLAPFLEGGRPGARVLVGTGHPFALLSHYGALSRALTAAGAAVLRPLEGVIDPVPTGRGRASIRFLDGVACLFRGAGLQHTHQPTAMEAMIAEAGGPSRIDLVVADHGFAGAAIEAGIATVSIADVNDTALPLAQHRGRTDAVLLIDDGLDASLFVPVTEALLGP